jgi:cytochrome d ubiquinol oxidase subunit II
MTHETLQVVWFILLFVLLAGYAVLDGFDFGVGMLHPLARGDDERRISINAIAPVWDGNEVWLITAGAALFAAFPPVYATVFSGFYLALVLLLMALIFRAVSMEFRSKVASPRWRSAWDGAFFAGSLLAPLLLGVAFGNVLRGLPLDEHGRYAGGFFDLLNPYALAVGLLTVATFLLHGAIYLMPKTGGEHQQRIERLIPVLWILFVVLYAVVSIATFVLNRHLVAGAAAIGLVWLLAPVLVCAAALWPLTRRRRWPAAFAVSSVMIVGIIALGAAGLFPRLVPHLGEPAAGLDIYNASSTRLTLLVMLIIALIGMPAVIAYTILIHRSFRGRVVLHEDSY